MSHSGHTQCNYVGNLPKNRRVSVLLFSGYRDPEEIFSQRLRWKDFGIRAVGGEQVPQFETREFSALMFENGCWYSNSQKLLKTQKLRL